MYVFLVARGASVPCGGRMLTFLATLANSSALLDFGEIRAGHWLGIAWGIRDLPLRTGGGVMVPSKGKPKIISLSFVVSLGGILSDNKELRDIYLIPGSKGGSFSFLN